MLARNNISPRTASANIITLPLTAELTSRAKDLNHVFERSPANDFGRRVQSAEKSGCK